jgi:hypothetical protein
VTAFTIQIESINFARDEKRGEDGAVWYLILSPCEDCKTNPDHHGCAGHPGMVHHYERQAFRLGSSGYRLDATEDEKANDRANVWGWDGNRDAPTLSPSFLALMEKNGNAIRPYQAHFFLRAGKIDLCGDSTVSLHPSPVPCGD